MRVALLAGSFPLLSETFVLNQVTGLLDRGVEVEVFAGRPKGEGPVHRNWTAYHLAERTTWWPGRLRDLPLTGVRLLAAPFRSRGRRLLARGLRPAPGGAPLGLLERLGMGLACTARGRYDALLAHFGPLGMIADELRRLGVLEGPLATVFHGYDLSGLLKERGEGLYAGLLPRLELALPVSDHWRRRLLELGAAEERIAVHHMGIDTDRFAYRPRRPAEDGTVTLLAIARLVEKKGLEYAVRALARVADRHPGVRLRVVGDGPTRSELERTIAETGTADRVELLGWRTTEEVAELLDQAQLLIAPSVTAADGDMEGIPVSIMEAMAQGLPVITTRHSGIPELVEDGRSGYLVPERDVDALADALNRILGEPERWPDMGSHGRAKVERDFNQSRLDDGLVEILRRLPPGR